MSYLNKDIENKYEYLVDLKEKVGKLTHLFK